MFDSQIPPNLNVWRLPGDSVAAEEKVWEDLINVFQDRGYTSWTHVEHNLLVSPDTSHITPSGYAYVNPSRGITGQGIGTLFRLVEYEYIVCIFFLHVALFSHWSCPRTHSIEFSGVKTGLMCSFVSSKLRTKARPILES